MTSSTSTEASPYVWLGVLGGDDKCDEPVYGDSSEEWDLRSLGERE